MCIAIILNLAVTLHIHIQPFLFPPLLPPNYYDYATTSQLCSDLDIIGRWRGLDSNGRPLIALISNRNRRDAAGLPPRRNHRAPIRPPSQQPQQRNPRPPPPEEPVPAPQLNGSLIE